MRALLVLAPLAALLAAVAPPSSPVPALVDRVVAAYGGREALEKGPVVVQEGEITAHAPGEVGRVTRIYERPRHLRVTIGYPGGASEQRILDGDRAWRDRREVTGTPPHGAMSLQAARLELPLSLLAGVARVADEGTVEVDGKRLRVLRLPLGEGASLAAEIDEATGRIERTVARMPGGDVPLEFVTVYSDFRKVQGILVPFREENHVHGRHTGTTVLRRVEFLPEAPTGAFRP